MIAMSASAPSLDEGLLATGTKVGEYEIERLLGVGGMGEVYGARQPVIGKQVAIKVMSRDCSASPSNVERFVQEAKAVNAIGHPNIVDIFSFGRTEDGRCYFVMEWLPGQSLRHKIKQARLKPLEACEVLDGVLQALEAAHDHAIVHRDLKPDNIFCVSGRRAGVKLLDFGVAKLSGESFASKRASKTQTGTVVGTPSYMAPEQAAGAQVEAPADVYALGVVAFELATGRLPFEAESTVQIMAMHVCEPPPRPRDLAPMTREMDQLILDMLEKKPGDRPTAAQVRARLVDVRAAITSGVVERGEAPTLSLTPIPVEVVVPTTSDGWFAKPETIAAAATPVPEPRRRRRGMWIAIAAAVGAVAVVIAIASSSTRTPVAVAVPAATAAAAADAATAADAAAAAAAAADSAAAADAAAVPVIRPTRVRPPPASPPPPHKKKDVDAVQDPFQ